MERKYTFVQDGALRQLRLPRYWRLATLTFDETGHFLLYPTVIGVKMINISSNKLNRILGKVLLLGFSQRRSQAGIWLVEFEDTVLHC